MFKNLQSGRFLITYCRNFGPVFIAYIKILKSEPFLIT